MMQLCAASASTWYQMTFSFVQNAAAFPISPQWHVRTLHCQTCREKALCPHQLHDSLWFTVIHRACALPGEGWWVGGWVGGDTVQANAWLLAFQAVRQHGKRFEIQE